MIQQSKLKGAFLVASLLSTMVVGCRDFSDVEELGKRGQQIGESATEITRDFYQSCLRASQFPASSRIFALEKDYFGTVREERRICDEKYPPAQTDIGNAYLVYTTYFNQLMVLADKNTGAITDEQKQELGDSLNSLVTNLSAANPKLQIPSIVSDNISQGQTILSAIFGFIADETRQKVIASTIVCTDDEIQDYTKALVAISSQVYVNQLDIERGSFEENITNFTPAISAPTNDGSPVGTLTVQESQSLLEMQNIVIAKEQELREKEVKAQDLSNKLKATANMHQQLSLVFAKELGLTKEKGEIDQIERDKFCQIYETKASENAQNKSDQEEKLEISPTGRKEIHKIIKEYNLNTEYLVD